MPQNEVEKKPSKKKLTEEEKRQKKLEKQQKLLRDHFEREINFNDLSYKRNEKTHFELTEKFKIENILTNLTADVQFSLHLFDKSENAIETTKVHREHAFEQHIRVQRTQSKLISYLIDLFNLFQNSLKGLYETKRKCLIEDFFVETVNRERLLYEQKRYYENFAHASVSLLKSRLENEKEGFIDNKINIEAVTVLKNEEMEGRKLKLEMRVCNEIEKIFKEFTMIWPRHRMDEYKTTFNEDIRICKEIDELAIKICHIEGEVDKLRKLWNKKNAEMNLKLSKLKFEQHSLLKMLNARKLKIQDGCDMDYEKLKVLVKASTEAFKYLKQKVIVLERMESAIKLCKKHERLEDKLKLYDITNESSDEKASEKSFNLESLASIHLMQPTSQNYSYDDQIAALSNNMQFICDDKNQQSFLRDINTKASECFQEHSKMSDTQISTQNSFLQIFTNRDFNINYPSENESDDKVSNKSSNISVISTLKHPSRTHLFSSQSFHINEAVVDKFFEKLAKIEAECLMLKNYRQKMSEDNEKLKNLLKSKKREFGVKKNMRLLRLNTLPSVGKIGQISHHMPQIYSELVTQKCRDLHLKFEKENKAF